MQVDPGKGAWARRLLGRVPLARPDREPTLGRVLHWKEHRDAVVVPLPERMRYSAPFWWETDKANSARVDHDDSAVGNFANHLAVAENRTSVSSDA
jgi:hypothetical protein